MPDSNRIIAQASENRDNTRQFKAGLKFIEQLVLNPNSINRQSIEALYQQGLSKDQIAVLIYITTAQLIMNKTADSLDYELPQANDLQRMGKIIAKHGYWI